MSVSTSKSREERLREAIRIKQAQNRARSNVIPVRSAEQRTELHELQQGMWLAHMLNPDSPAYNLVSACRVRGELNLVLLQQAYRQLLSRHRLLRSTFVAAGDTVEQVIHDSVPDELERFQAAPGRLAARATEVAARPFDLAKPPLVRLVLVEADSGERLLVLVLHHLLADERSLTDLWRELAGLMDGTVGSSDAPQYDDWAAWRRTRDEAEPATEAEAFEYWRQKLSPPPEALTLPFLSPESVPDRAGRLLLGTRLGSRRA